MKPEPTSSNLAQAFNPVKSSNPDGISPSSDGMTHHKAPRHKILNRRVIYKGYIERPYGVSSNHKLLTKGLLIKKWNYVKDCLINVCGLTTTESEVVLVLLRLQVYYPQVYPKAAQVAEEAHCSISTFWRAVGKLRDTDQLKVVNRYLIRIQAQISNLYLLTTLLIAIARYLAEHIAYRWPRWFHPWLALPLREFEAKLYQTPESRASPLPF